MKGEADFTTADGKTYRLLIDHNALAEAEDAADMQADELISVLNSKPRIKHLRALLYGALKAYHPTVTVLEAGRLMGEGEVVGAAIGKAMKGAFPQAAGESTEGKDRRRAGAGMNAKPPGRKKG